MATGNPGTFVIAGSLYSLHSSWRCSGFIDDLIQMSYSVIRTTNDPMTEFKQSQYSRMKHKNDLLHRPRTVLSVSLSWMTPPFEAIGSQKPLFSIDYQLVRGSVDAIIPENDALGDLNLQTVDKEFELIQVNPTCIKCLSNSNQYYFR